MKGFFLYIIDDHINKANKSKVLKSILSEKVHIKWISINERLISKISLPDSDCINTYSRDVHLRFLAPYILPSYVKKVIYLDSDLIVLKDISKLWGIDFKDNIILAVRDSFVRSIGSRYGVVNYKQLGINPRLKYFNSGVLVINIEKWRNEEITPKLIECLRKNKNYAQFPDQYGLNVILINKWGELNSRWNQFPDAKKKNSKAYILHYVGLKPHMRNGKSFFNEKTFFNDYFDLTQLKGWRPNN